MIFLDMRTIIFSYVLTNIVCLFVIILLWLQTRKRFTGNAFWVFDFFFQTLALVLIVLRGSIPDWASMVVANILVMIGALLGYVGLLRFAGKKSGQIHNYIILTLLLMVHVYFSLVQPDLAIRSFNTSAGLLIITAQCAWLLLYRVGPDMRRLTRNVGIVFCFYGLVSIIRMAEFFAGHHIETDFFHSGSFDLAAMIAYQILFILLTYSLTLMFNKRLLADITKQEEKFSKAFHSSPYAILLTRLSNGRIIEVNDGFVRISGYDDSEIKGETTLSLNLWSREEDRSTVLSELSGNHKVQGTEFQFRRKSGEKFTGLFSAELITINNEKCVLASIDDISDRKHMEEALHETRDYLENLFNYANAPIIVWDSKFRITKFNRAFERLSGRKEPDVLGHEVDMFFPAATRDQSLEYIKKTSAGDRWETVEIEIQHVDGSIRTLLWNSAAIYMADGKTVLSTIAQGHDITIRKQAQEEISRLNKELEQKVAGQTRELRDSQMALLNLVDDLNASTNKIAAANQSLEAVNKELAAFSYSVSHDLRAPLRSIDGFSEALLEDYGDKLDNEAKNYLERIRRATQNMGRLIDDLLSLSQVMKSDFYRQDFDLSAMVHEIAGEIQQKNTLKGLIPDIEDGIVVKADQRLINIVMTNLLDNAWKFTSKSEHPHIEFGANVRNGETVFFVRDNGAGFNMEYVDKIFEAFQRLHRMEEFPGTGIGLATVQRIINRHNGRIWAEGEPGKGATFFFTLGG